MEKFTWFIFSCVLLPLIIIYTIKLKSDRILVIIMLLFAISFAGSILNYLFQAPLIAFMGMVAGTVIAPAIFSIYLFARRNAEDGKGRKFMLVPTLTLILFYLLKILHLPGAGLLNLVMLFPIVIGILPVVNYMHMKENKPLHIILALLIADFLMFLMKGY